MLRTRSIDPTRTYSVREVAHAINCGRYHLYRDIDRGRLRAARLNDRGDYRVLGQWLIEYLELLASAARNHTN
jgi:excisionase family DNA binding protein